MATELKEDTSLEVFLSADEATLTFAFRSRRARSGRSNTRGRLGSLIIVNYMNTVADG